MIQLGHPIGSALVIAQIEWGLGRHTFYLTEHQFREFLKYSFGEWLQVRPTKQEIQLRRLMSSNSDVCHFDVYQSLHLHHDVTYHNQQSLH